MSWKSFERDFDCTMALFGKSKDDYYLWPFNGALDIMMGPKSKIEPNDSFVGINIFLEFPELITLHDSRKEQDTEIHKKFIKEYIGTGKICHLCVWLRDAGTFYSEPIEIKSRNEKEIKAIEIWYGKFKNFLSATSRVLEQESPREFRTWIKAPTVKDYEDFEKQLSPGTLKNYIQFRRLLASIPDSNDNTTPILTPDESFRKLGYYLDTLHPLERGVLINDALKYFEESPGNNDQKMKYLLLPKLPKSDREKWINRIRNQGDRKMLLDMPEPPTPKE